MILAIVMVLGVAPMTVFAAPVPKTGLVYTMVLDSTKELQASDLGTLSASGSALKIDTVTDGTVVQSEVAGDGATFSNFIGRRLRK